MQSTQRQIIKTESECLEQDVNIERIRMTHVHASAVLCMCISEIWRTHTERAGKWEIPINLRLKIKMKLVLAQLSPF